MTSDLSSFSMLDLFRTEVEGQTAVLNDGLLALEKNPGSIDAIEPLMRAAHSIKGAARIVQLTIAVTLAHAMEDCFVAAQEKKIVLASAHIDLLLKGVDIFTALSKVSETEIDGWLRAHQKDIDKLSAEIKALQTKVEPAQQYDASLSAAEEVAVLKTPDVSMHKDKIADGKDSFVRISAENLNRLMSIAGEFLVETRWLSPFSNALVHLKKRAMELADILSNLNHVLDEAPQDPRSEGYMHEARQKINEYSRLISERINDFELFARRSSRLANHLHREVLVSRMRPFADGIQVFPRMVRDLAKNFDKKVRFETSGETTDVDRDILEKLEAPLTHILRNAVDHGIEPPDERIAAGKPGEGTIMLEAQHKAGMLSITVSDDGRGIDFDKLRSKIVARRYVNEDMAANLTDNELLDFLFLPGFSTADKVSEISGRGVGLDVVQNMVHGVGGIVRMASKKGIGTTLNLKLPLTLSVMRTLLVAIGDEPYAFPLSRIERCVLIHRDTLDLLEDRQYITIDGHHVGLVAAHQVLDVKDSCSHNENLSIIVIGDQVSRYGVVVDRFLGERELVVQPIDSRLGKIRDISAAALMVDGSPVLIVDVEDIIRSIENLLAAEQLRKIGQFQGKDELHKRKHVLVIDDSITVRETERKLLENTGYDVDVAVNGMDGWNAIRTGHYDLVISDVDMPRMNGFELTRLVRQDPRLKDIPIMIVSYKDREEDRLRGLEVGANYYLTKSSFHDETFINAVVDLIGKA